MATFTQTITLTSGFGSPPSQALNAGFSTLAFFDDFTSASTLSASTSTAYNSSIKWYASQQTQTSPTNYQFLTTTSAGQLANNNTSGGTNASPSGGLLKMTGHPSITNQGQFTTIPNSGMGTDYRGPGTYSHGYFEAYLQYDASVTNSHNAWWLLSPNYVTETELDILECINGAIYCGTLHTPAGGANDPGTPLNDPNVIGNQPPSSEWHTYGVLWEITGPGTGRISLWIDNAQIGTYKTTGVGANRSTLLENDVLCLILGVNSGWALYCDWVRVWQAPSLTSTPPPQAIAAGFTNQVFFDDFTSDTFAATAGASRTIGKNWFTYQAQTSPTNYQVLATTTASQISNGNTSGGNFASTSGGIVKFSGHSALGNEMQFFTVPTANWGTGGATGTYKHCYVEAYVQYSASGSSTNGWPAWWSYSCQDAATSGVTGTEVDFMELEATLGEYGGTVHVNGAPALSGTPLFHKTPTSEWHKIGMLWKSTGSGVGTISMWFNDVKVGNDLPTGTGSGVPGLENDYLFFVLGTGVGWTLHVDWVSIWQ
jgi:hypothetical protein